MKKLYVERDRAGEGNRLEVLVPAVQASGCTTAHPLLGKQTDPSLPYNQRKENDLPMSDVYVSVCCSWCKLIRSLYIRSDDYEVCVG
jgi:hypothetical protein